MAEVILLCVIAGVTFTGVCAVERWFGDDND